MVIMKTYGKQRRTFYPWISPDTRKKAFDSATSSESDVSVFMPPKRARKISVSSRRELPPAKKKVIYLKDDSNENSYISSPFVHPTQQNKPARSVRTSNRARKISVSSRRALRPAKKRVTTGIRTRHMVSSAEKYVNDAGTASSPTNSVLREIFLNESADHSLKPCPRKPLFCSTPSAPPLGKHPRRKLPINHQSSISLSISVSHIDLLSTSQEDLESPKQHLSPPFLTPLSSGEREKHQSTLGEPQKESSGSEKDKSQNNATETQSGGQLSSQKLSLVSRETRHCTVQLQRLDKLTLAPFKSQTTYSSGHSSSVHSQQTPEHPLSVEGSQTIHHSHSVGPSFQLVLSVNSNETNKYSQSVSDICDSADAASSVSDNQITDNTDTQQVYNSRSDQTQSIDPGTEERAAALILALKEKCLTEKVRVKVKRATRSQWKGTQQLENTTHKSPTEVSNSANEGQSVRTWVGDDHKSEAVDTAKTDHRNRRNRSKNVGTRKRGSTTWEDKIPSGNKNILRNPHGDLHTKKKPLVAPNEKRRRRVSRDRFGTSSERDKSYNNATETQSGGQLSSQKLSLVSTETRHCTVQLQRLDKLTLAPFKCQTTYSSLDHSSSVHSQQTPEHPLSVEGSQTFHHSHSVGPSFQLVLSVNSNETNKYSQSVFDICDSADAASLVSDDQITDHTDTQQVSNSCSDQTQSNDPGTEERAAALILAQKEKCLTEKVRVKVKRATRSQWKGTQQLENTTHKSPTEVSNSANDGQSVRTWVGDDHKSEAVDTANTDHHNRRNRSKNVGKRKRGSTSSEDKTPSDNKNILRNPHGILHTKKKPLVAPNEKRRRRVSRDRFGTSSERDKSYNNATETQSGGQLSSQKLSLVSTETRHCTVQLQRLDKLTLAPFKCQTTYSSLDHSSSVHSQQTPEHPLSVEGSQTFHHSHSVGPSFQLVLSVNSNETNNYSQSVSDICDSADAASLVSDNQITDNTDTQQVSNSRSDQTQSIDPGTEERAAALILTQKKKCLTEKVRVKVKRATRSQWKGTQQLENTTHKSPTEVSNSANDGQSVRTWVGDDHKSEAVDTANTDHRNRSKNVGKRKRGSSTSEDEIPSDKNILRNPHGILHKKKKTPVAPNEKRRRRVSRDRFGTSSERDKSYNNATETQSGGQLSSQKLSLVSTETRHCTVQLQRLDKLTLAPFKCQTTYSSLDHSSSVHSQQTPEHPLSVEGSQTFHHSHSVGPSFQLVLSVNSNETNSYSQSVSDICDSADAASSVSDNQITDNTDTQQVINSRSDQTQSNDPGTEERAAALILAQKEKCLTEKVRVKVKRATRSQWKGTQQLENTTHKSPTEVSNSANDGQSVRTWVGDDHKSEAVDTANTDHRNRSKNVGKRKRGSSTSEDDIPSDKNFLRNPHGILHKKKKPLVAPNEKRRRSMSRNRFGTSSERVKSHNNATETQSGGQLSSQKLSLVSTETRHCTVQLQRLDKLTCAPFKCQTTYSSLDHSSSVHSQQTPEHLPSVTPNEKKKRSVSRDRFGTSRKAIVSGLSVSRWKNKGNTSAHMSQSQAPQRGGSKAVDWNINELLSTQHKQPTGTSVDFSTPVRATQLNLSSLLADLTPDTHTWSRLKAAVSVHRKTKVSLTPPMPGSPGGMGLADVSQDLFRSPLQTPLSKLYQSQLLSASVDADLSDEEKVYAECGQQGPLPWECILPQQCEKIGEGTFGEVFSTTNASGDLVALKIIPVEGSEKVNGENQKTFGEILHEIIISKELSSLKEKQQNQTHGFIGLIDLHCVRGCYPTAFLDAWDAFDQQKGSENDRPDMFEKTQLFLILEFEFGGSDLESSNAALSSVIVAKSILHQVTAALAVAEQELHFEHRDLHWGNVLVKPTKEKKGSFLLNGATHSLKTKGVVVRIIDYSLSRLEIDGLTVSCDISEDEELFMGQGDYQFDIYRLMREENRNNWSKYQPHSNVLWLHYLASKLLSMKYRRKGGRGTKDAWKELRQFHESLIQYHSATEVLNCPMFHRCAGSCFK